MNRFLLIMLAVAFQGSIHAENTIDLAPVEKWIARSAGIKTVIADFKQERQLRTVKKPLESIGRVWIDVTVGGLRMQSGDPAKVIAVLAPQGDLTVLQVEKKEAEIMPRATLERDRAGQALSFVMAGFPKSLAAFEERFNITAVVSEQAWHRIELKPKGTGKSFAVMQLILMVEQSTSRLAAMHVMLRDGSRISHNFTRIQENAVIPNGTFTADTRGYVLKTK